MDPLLTVTDVADFLAVAETTVWKWKREGKIASIEMGKSTRFQLCDIEEFVQSNKVIRKPASLEN
jgi:excisionase family DNA binding protein